MDFPQALASMTVPPPRLRPPVGQENVSNSTPRADIDEQSTGQQTNSLPFIPACTPSHLPLSHRYHAAHRDPHPFRRATARRVSRYAAQSCRMTRAPVVCHALPPSVRPGYLRVISKRVDITNQRESTQDGQAAKPRDRLGRLAHPWRRHGTSSIAES